jgi:hypothetical protein
MDCCCERERNRDTERERIAAARQAISDARLLLETALLMLDRLHQGGE